MKYAYVSLLFGKGNYYEGAYLLGKLLNKFSPKIDRILLVTPDVPEKNIKKIENLWKIKEVKYLEFPKILSKKIPEGRKYYSKVFTKFHLFNLTEYKKILFVDLSYMPLSNKINQLFNYPTPSSAFEIWRLKNKDINPKQIITTKMLKEAEYNLNGSLMLFKPSTNEFNKIINKLENYEGEKLYYPEQQFLGYYYENKVHLIDPLYYCNIEYPQCNNECYGIKLLSKKKLWDKNKKSYDKCDILWHNIYKNIE